MILIGAAPPAAIEAMERIRAAVAGKEWSATAPNLPVTLSAGIASHRKGQTVEQMLHDADLALYRAKDAGRNTIIASNFGGGYLTVAQPKPG
jgi:diguanylate cyclase (GGDEF)-like protein